MRAVVAGLAASLAAWSAAATTHTSTRRAGLRPPASARRAFVAVAAALILLAAPLVHVPSELLAASGAGVIATVVVVRRTHARRRRAALATDVVTLCLAVACEVRAGRMPAEAVASSCPQLVTLGDSLAAAARAAANGAPLDRELATVADELSTPRLATVAAVLAACAVTGARVADVLERVAAAFIADDEARADLDALAAAPRATATVLCALPVFGVALATMMGSHPLAMLLHSAVGALLVAGAVLLDVCGLLWVRAVTARALCT